MDDVAELQPITTGLPGLDGILDSLRIGDNVVWTVDCVAEYRAFVDPFVAAALRDGRRIVYFRFAEHAPLVTAHASVTRHVLNASHGFEAFTSAVYEWITHHGREAFCVFDCLSDLLSAWATDQMIGNFFQVICPYLYRLDTIAYFALLRGHHSFRTTAQIRQTTQVMVGVYTRDSRRHVHPIKVWQRHSPTMFLPHEIRGDDFVPLANSYEATTLLSDVRRLSVDSPKRRLDYWDRLFLEAEAVADINEKEPGHLAMVDKLCRVIIGQDERILELARRHLSLRDLLAIKSRMIGTGFIGGKAVGMLLARKILLTDESHDWNSELEPHDSFYVGSDAFYGFLVHNGWWDLLMRQKTSEGYFDAAAELEQKMREGQFPEEMVQAFQQMLEYFGQYPLVVRSSSLLEDGFGGAFAGKYESHFCVNQGAPEQRLKQFMEAVRRIFASTMSHDALSYRRQRGLAHREEPMGLLVQRVAGRYYGHLYMPDMAGVGVSYNTFVWHRGMDPHAGMLRIVMGLGTRAVDRVEGDYPCTVALDQPLRRAYGGHEDMRRFTQRDIDLLNVERNTLQSLSLMELVRGGTALAYERFAVPDRQTERLLRDRGERDPRAWLVTFEPLLRDTPFPALMQRLLKTLERAYDYPVDVEFTLTFDEQDRQWINLVQCRPLQTQGTHEVVQFPTSVPPDRVLFRTQGHFMGGSVQLAIHRVIWVDPAAYARATMDQRHDIARLIGTLNRGLEVQPQPATLLIGPGRWGTSTPSLGVPVRFFQINNMAALVEVASQEAGIVPELSYGTHFFQDLVETNTFYAALAVDRADCQFSPAYLEQYPNQLAVLAPDAEGYERFVKVCDTTGRPLQLFADTVRQEAICCEA
ncbi:MAG: PEP/pyruvate-binding domain-containing protein [Phycisphaeraceae bacterium]